MPAHAGLPRKTANWSGELNLQNNNPGERKTGQSHQLDWFLIASGFSNILCYWQSEMVLGAAVQKDAWISR